MNIKLQLLVALFGLVSVAQACAELYRWTDEHGRVQFSDRKSSVKAETYQPKSSISTYSTPDGIQVVDKQGDYSDLPPYEKRRDTADIEKLHAVQFPQSPSRKSVAAYIQKIYAISRYQKRHLNSDPQVSLLMQVGTEYLDVLINETHSHVGWHDYGLEAIGKLATEQHKAAVFKALKTHNKYAKIIYLKEWHFEIQDELIKGLRNNRGYVPSEWLKAVAEFDRQEAKDVLVEYFKYGWNNHSTYNIVSGLKGVDEQLKDALPIAWETARENNKHAMVDLTSKVLELGYMPAFKFVMMSLMDNANMQKHWFNAYELALRYTEQTGTAREIMEWFRLNQKHIRFDAGKKLFIQN